MNTCHMPNTGKVQCTSYLDKMECVLVTWRRTVEINNWLFRYWKQFVKCTRLHYSSSQNQTLLRWLFGLVQIEWDLLRWIEYEDWVIFRAKEKGGLTTISRTRDKAFCTNNTCKTENKISRVRPWVWGPTHCCATKEENKAIHHYCVKN